ncbi:MAG TPA: Uma2 family endonuclease [Oscillatoriales cyanobacterium M59_W2019_021]|nr:MAG: Uma2 family endonuclease [Cyanobacteria bacterium J055]HIK32352.1 Uma2 family endonuclease [Oscillatoriales cyanobacterium M4454_W2019_049]HIK52946.1 Uma2 family endonuclease [Oscillatoriales cyanobacterium M59_W2019_021]
MTIATSGKLTFDRFLEEYPDDQGRYELVDGEIVEMRAIRWHDDIADFLIRKFDRQVERSHLKYRVTGRLVLATTSADGQQQGRRPDVSVVSLSTWESNRFAYAALDEPIQLVVEVVSTNWEDDYIDKLDEYQRLGIVEYWIVDYLAIGSRSYLGRPKVPTIFVYHLDETGVYRSTAFKGDDRIISPTFPDLELTLNQILEA